MHAVRGGGGVAACVLRIYQVRPSYCDGSTMVESVRGLICRVVGNIVFCCGLVDAQRNCFVVACCSRVLLYAH